MKLGCESVRSMPCEPPGDAIQHSETRRLALALGSCFHRHVGTWPVKTAFDRKAECANPSTCHGKHKTSPSSPLLRTCFGRKKTPTLIHHRDPFAIATISADEEVLLQPQLLLMIRCEPTPTHVCCRQQYVQAHAGASSAPIEPAFPEPAAPRSQLDKVADVLTTMFPVWV